MMRTQLKNVVAVTNGKAWQVGVEYVEGTCTEIVLRCDGNGPMGHFDQIHVYVDDKLILSGPAHQMVWWEYA